MVERRVDFTASWTNTGNYWERFNIPPERRAEDTDRMQRRHAFKRDYGKAAREYAAGDPHNSRQLTELSRKQKRAFYRAAIDFASVEIYGQTAAEERGLVYPTVSRNIERLEHTRFPQVQPYIELAQDAGHSIVVACEMSNPTLFLRQGPVKQLYGETSL